MDFMTKLVILSAVTVLVYSACDKGWSSYQNKCIYFSNTQLFWNEAEVACEKMHAFLVTIDTEEKMNYITQFLNVFSSFHYNHYWFGLKDAIQEGHWRWVETGSDVGSYTKWMLGQPDGDIAQNCATTTWNGTDVYWMDAKCEGAHPGAHGGYYYICEKVATS